MKLIFFFQAEDGIRDRSPSRGLGDVYKRQTYRHFFINNLLRVKDIIVAINKMDLVDFSETVFEAVSYTHLTLPTNREV